MRHFQTFGELGAADNPAAAQATDMEKDRNVWAGYTWWSAGPWWGEYMFTLEPKNSQNRPLMTTLQPFLQKKQVK